jgi:hypothetical protein
MEGGQRRFDEAADPIEGAGPRSGEVAAIHEPSEIRIARQRSE